MSSAPRRLYVQQLLGLYLLVPGTAGHPRRSDRLLAVQLHQRGVPLGVIHAAFILAVARRTFRSPGASALAPIATLHYFQPVIDELLAHPCEPDYLDYLRHKLATVAPALVAACGHQLA